MHTLWHSSLQQQETCKFGYTPILYNEEEEARKKKLEKRVLEIKKKMGVIPDEPKQEPKAFVRSLSLRHATSGNVRRRVGWQSLFLSNNLVLILIVALLFAIFYFWIMR